MFLLYTADVLAIVRRHSMGGHSYADDTQVYKRFPANICDTSMPAMVTCIGDINHLMTSNRLKLNADKTDFILLGSRQQLAKLNQPTIHIYGVNVLVSPTVTCLGVLIDRRLTGRCFYQMRQLRTNRRTLTTEAAKTLVHAFVISRVHYCNSIFGLASAVHLHPLQSVVNAAARLIVKRQKYDHITDSLRDDLHWRPVQYRFTYKLCTFVYECVHGEAPRISPNSAFL